MLTIGIPRALHYFRYYPLAHSFCQTLGVNVVVSPPTTREMLSTGMSCVVAETCLPIKAFCGHVIWLQDKVDYVFVPSLRCIEAPLYNCVKLFALPDMVRGAIKKAPVLDMGYDMSQGTQAIYKGIFALGQQLGFRRKQILAACESALRTHTIYLRLLRQGISLPQAIEAACGQQLSTSAEAERKVGQQTSPPRSATVGIVGHPYITYDDYLNNNLIPRLTKLGVHLMTADTLGRDDLDMGVRQVIGEPYWMYEREITGAAGYFLRSHKVDGVITVSAFGCGPDSMMIDAVQHSAKRERHNPLLSLTIDEHTAETGLVTRLEAFVDMVEKRRTDPCGEFSSPSFYTPGHTILTHPVKLTFPHMGTTRVALKVLFDKIGVETIVPPPCSKRTLDLAVKYSPEGACLPYKLNLGNYIEGLELGANTLIQLSGPNNCRYGYYHKLQEQVLRDLGYQFQMALPEISGRTIKGVIDVLQEMSGASFRQCLSAILLGLEVIHDVDEIERQVQYVRARELKKGTANKIWQQILNEMEKVRTRSALKSLKKRFQADLAAVPMDRNRRPLKVCIVGEIYVVHEPYVNQDIEVELGKMGVEVNRAEQVSEWLTLSPELILEALGFGHKARIRKAEKPYLKYWSGETVGQAVLAEEDGYDGVIQLAPFTCMPEIVAQNIMPKLKERVNIPILTLVLDEQTGRAGLLTRLEAFVDSLQRRPKPTRGTQRWSLVS